MGQGNIFRSACQEFCPPGGSASVHAGILPPGTGQAPTRTRHPPPGPGVEHARRYGQRADGTHPTVMHSCFMQFLTKIGWRPTYGDGVAPVWEILDSPLNFYRPQRSCGQGFAFTCVCDSVHRGGSPGRENPPEQGEPPQTRQIPPGQGDPLRTRETPRTGRPPRPGRPPWTRQTPPQTGRPPTLDQADPPPGPGRPPPRPGRPPRTRRPPPGPGRPPPGKQTPEYGLRAAGTHPTGMDSCNAVFILDVIKHNLLKR